MPAKHNMLKIVLTLEDYFWIATISVCTVNNFLRFIYAKWKAKVKNPVNFKLTAKKIE